ncbi:hypothetical protein [Dialister invisus]|uniref:hypothetical protein n=1 Tax=Dialister invisus TaxID=218538 RepID=UPI0027B95E71|nr:hypothetical protein [Dialister invisus]
MKTIREIDISEIDAKSKEIRENINYDEVRNRIRQVLDKITDKKNRGKKVSQETIGKYLFPYLGSESSTQSNMSRFINGNKGAKHHKTETNCPSMNALIRLAQLTGISTDWFLYGEESTEIDNKKKTLRDYARLMLIDMKNDLGAKIMLVNCPPDCVPIPTGKFPVLRIEIPVGTYTIDNNNAVTPLHVGKFVEWASPMGDLLRAVKSVNALDSLMEQTPINSPAYPALSNSIQLTIQGLASVLPPFFYDDDEY